MEEGNDGFEKPKKTNKQENSETEEDATPNRLNNNRLKQFRCPPEHQRKRIYNRKDTH